MRYDIISILCFLILSCGTALSLKCYMCSIHASTPSFMPQVPCRTPAQQQCRSSASLCVTLIIDRAMYLGCVDLLGHSTDTFFEQCRRARNVSEDNCRTCSTNLCNSAKVGPNISAILSLLLILAAATFIRIVM